MLKLYILILKTNLSLFFDKYFSEQKQEPNQIFFQTFGGPFKCLIENEHPK